MRFSSLAVLVSAVVAVPLAGAVTAPMEQAAFVQSARCAAVESLAGEASFGPARVNAEARRQSPHAVAEARSAIADVTTSAAHGGEAAISAERALACGGMV